MMSSRKSMSSSTGSRKYVFSLIGCTRLVPHVSGMLKLLVQASSKVGVWKTSSDAAVFSGAVV